MSQSPEPQTVSIVVPVLNEAAALPETIRRAQANASVREILVVDGGSRDATRAIAAELGCRLLASPPGRGGQMRLGASAAQGNVVMFLHADTWLPPGATRAALHCLRDETVVAGGFWKVFDRPRWFMRGSRLRCWLRLVLGRRILGDQTIFVRRAVLERIGGMPDLPLMEEWELCRRLRRVGRLVLADATVVTSARRFAVRGAGRTYLRMGWVTLLYRCGMSPEKLRRIYERD